jgi:hypothetical protein
VQCYLGPTSCASAMAHESSMAAALPPVVAAKKVPHATRGTAGTQKWAKVHFHFYEQRAGRYWPAVKPQPGSAVEERHKGQTLRASSGQQCELLSRSPPASSPLLRGLGVGPGVVLAYYLVL